MIDNKIKEIRKIKSNILTHIAAIRGISRYQDQRQEYLLEDAHTLGHIFVNFPKN
jgi:hypothetical protein